MSCPNCPHCNQMSGRAQCAANQAQHQGQMREAQRGALESMASMRAQQQAANQMAQQQGVAYRGCQCGKKKDE